MSKQANPRTTYKSAGVDIDSGNALVENIKPIVAGTARLGSHGKIGSFGGLFDLSATTYKDPVLVSGTDGVGTKLLIAIESKIYDTIGIDLVAMCANDVLSQGAEPLFFLDYFSCGKLDISIAENVIKGIADGCLEAGCALIGGETAEMPGMYSKDHFDLAGFCVGAVERSNILPTNNVKSGDIVFGLPSSGAHANGYSLIRKIINETDSDLLEPAPFDKHKILAEVLLRPTRIYVKEAIKVIQSNIKIKAFAHITGGGLVENITRVLPDSTNLIINTDSWELPPLFQWLHKCGNLDFIELYRTFNCGIGFAIIINPDEEISLRELLDFEPIKIGEIVDGNTANPPSCKLLGLGSE